jgi:hypothetical protein
MSDNAETLFKQGQELLAQGERAKAVDVLKRAIEQDSENVDIWVALAKALDDVAEKRIALTTILQLDPDNEYARGDLDETEKPKSAVLADEELVPGITRKEAQRYAIGLVAFTVLMLFVTFSFTGSQASQREDARRRVAQEIANATATVDVATQLAITVQFEETERAIEQTQAFLARVSPTPTMTPTRSRADALPTPLPTELPTHTPLPLRFLAPPPVGAYSGRIFAWGGVNPAGRAGLRFRVYAPQEGEPRQLNEDFVQFVTVDGSGQRVVYMKLIQSEWSMVLVNTQTPESSSTTNLGGVLLTSGVREPERARLSADGEAMVFIGVSPQNRKAVYLHTFRTGQTLRLTFDDADYTGAAVNGNNVIAVRRDANGTDLVYINAADGANSFPQRRLTQDGDALVESSPSFSSDGVFVVYSAYSRVPTDNDLYIARLNVDANLFTTEALVTTGADEIYPAFSPDGGAVLYSSDANGVYNLFIFDRTSRQTYQLTADSLPVFAGGWGR